MELFEQSIKAQIADRNPRHIVAIDIDSGDFEVGPDPLSATDPLFLRRPDAQIFRIRVDATAVVRFGRLIADVTAPRSDKPRWRKLS
jgi:hypothetical protein